MGIELQSSLLEVGSQPPIRRQLGGGAWVDLAPGWCPDPDELLTQLSARVPWLAERREMYDRMVDVPRLVAHYDGRPTLPPPLASLRERLNTIYADELGEPLISAGLCLYRDGRDSVAWHGDRIGRGRNEDTLVAIVSLGTARALTLRPRGGGTSIKYLLGHGDLFVMGGSCQRTWDHAVPKASEVTGPRISVCSSVRGGCVELPPVAGPGYHRGIGIWHADRVLLDHVSYAAEQDGLIATTKRLADSLGVEPLDGGYHPTFGTRNMLLPLQGLRYVEVVEVLDHPVAAKALFGQVVRQRSEDGGGWLGWVVSTGDLSRFERRLQREAVDGFRRRPDGVELRWKQIGLRGLASDPQLPYIVKWEIPDEVRPGADKPSDVEITTIQIAGDQDRVRDWLGTEVGEPLGDVKVDWVAPHGQPGIMSVSFATEKGTVTI